MGKGVYVEPSRGRWRVRTGVWDTEKQKTKMVTCGTFDSESEARALEATLIAELREMRKLERVTMRDVALAYLRKKNAPEYTWSVYRNHFENDEIADQDPQLVTPEMALDFFDRLLEKRALRVVAHKKAREPKRLETTQLKRKISRRTAEVAFNFLRSVLAYAYAKGLVKQVVTLGLKLPRGKSTQEHGLALRPEQVERLLANIPVPERYMFAFAIFTGLRAGELVALRRRDIHASDVDPHIWVRHGGAPKLNSEEELEWPPTKGGKARKVPLLDAALDALEAWDREAPAYLEEGGRRNPLDLAFPRQGGGVRSSVHLLKYEHWTRVKKAAGVPSELRVHDLRHTCATSLLYGWWGDRKWTVHEVKGMLGHSSIAVTERYLHAHYQALVEAAAQTRGMRKRQQQEETPTVPRTTAARPNGGPAYHDLSALPPELGAKPLISFVGRRGLEPRTYGLKVRSSNEQNQPDSSPPNPQTLPHSFHAFRAAQELANVFLAALEVGSVAVADPLLGAFLTAAVQLSESSSQEFAEVGETAVRILAAKARGETLRAKTLAIELAACVLALDGTPSETKKVAR